MTPRTNTGINSQLYRQIEQEAAHRGKRIDEIVEEALEEWLERRREAVRRSVVDQSFGALRADLDVVRAAMEDDDGLLDT